VALGSSLFQGPIEKAWQVGVPSVIVKANFLKSVLLCGKLKHSLP
jgi:hypothetical protein